jgi:hypothetical protein
LWSVRDLGALSGQLHFACARLDTDREISDHITLDTDFEINLDTDMRLNRSRWRRQFCETTIESKRTQ